MDNTDDRPPTSRHDWTDDDMLTAYYSGLGNGITSAARMLDHDRSISSCMTLGVDSANLARRDPLHRARVLDMLRDPGDSAPEWHRVPRTIEGGRQ